MSGLVSGADAQKLAMGTDMSHWDGDFPGEILKHFDFAWFKAADGDQLAPGDVFDPHTRVDVSFRANIQKAWDADIPAGIYLFIVPSFTNFTMDSIVDWHYQALKSATKGLIAGKSYHAIALDLEGSIVQTDTNWATIVNKLADKILSDPEYTPVTSVTGLTIYATNDWLNQRAALRDTISNKNVLTKYKMWMAQWPYMPGQGDNYKAINTTWAELQSKYIPSLNMRVATPGSQTWNMVQWSACFFIENYGIKFDLNFFHGDKAACWKWFNYTARSIVVTPPPNDPPTTPPPDPTIQAQITALGAILTAQQARLDAVEAKATAITAILDDLGAVLEKL